MFVNIFLTSESGLAADFRDGTGVLLSSLEDVAGVFLGFDRGVRV
jgi:hypothetical protein